MRLLSLIISVFLLHHYCSAQTSPSMNGEYYLRGVMETASGFKLNGDSTFEFFFSYGALDRFGAGTWKYVNGEVVFNSRPQPPKDFAMVKAEKVPGNFTTIKVVDNNQILVSYVNAVLTHGKSTVEKSTNSDGMIRIPKQPVDSIALLFRLCPDRYSTFALASKDINYVEFRFEPWIAEVFFKDFKLKFDKSQLIGRHPLLDGQAFTYER